MNDASRNLSDTQETDLDWDNRRLCSDESCTGTIGADGRCRVCGLLDPKAPVDMEQSADRNAAMGEPREPPSENQAPESQADPQWEDRKLCCDESCIGTIGKDGRCSICGLPG